MADAAIIPLYQGSGGRVFGTGGGEGRWTFFELLNDVTITQLGVVLKQPSPTEPALWEIFSTNSSGDYASFSLVFDTGVAYSPGVLQEQNTDVNVPLTAGFYALGLTVYDSSWRIDSVNNVSANYPNPTIDGNFRVLGGASSNLSAGHPPVNGGNTLLPKFSVGIQGFTAPSPPNMVPEPSSIFVLAGLLATFSAYSWVKRRRQAV